MHCGCSGIDITGEGVVQYVVVLTIIMSFLPRQDIYIVAAAA